MALRDLADSTTLLPLEDRLRHFITGYWLLPQDALILAEAERPGVRAVVSFDSDWRRFAGVDIYMSP